MGFDPGAAATRPTPKALPRASRSRARDSLVDADFDFQLVIQLRELHQQPAERAGGEHQHPEPGRTRHCPAPPAPQTPLHTGLWHVTPIPVPKRGCCSPKPPKGGLFWLLAAQSRQILPRANPIWAAAWLPRAKEGHKGAENKLEGLPAEGRRPDERHLARDNVPTPPTGRPRSGIYQKPACLQEHGTAPASSLAPCPESPRLCSSSSRTSPRGALPFGGELEAASAAASPGGSPQIPPLHGSRAPPAAGSQRPT